MKRSAKPMFAVEEYQFKLLFLICSGKGLTNVSSGFQKEQRVTIPVIHFERSEHSSPS